MMWITLLLGAVLMFSMVPVGETIDCASVPEICGNNKNCSWTCCYEDKISNCELPKSRLNKSFYRQREDASMPVGVRFLTGHNVYIPSTAVKKSKGNASSVMVVVNVINSRHFKLTSSMPRGGARSSPIVSSSDRVDGLVMGESVMAVKAGNHSVKDLSQPIRITFTHDNQYKNGTCVFWEEVDPVNGTGYWSKKGCDTNYTGTEFVCSCNHLSFFAVLVNPVLTVDKKNSENLSYINYVGSALSVLLTIITLIIYICLQRKRAEKAIGVHMHLTGALLCLHSSFLLGSMWVLVDGQEEQWVCRALGMFLHWSLLASFSWMALEGFHLYLLLVRVFNIYVRRYLLKLSLVGWGLPTVVAAICGILGVYGKYDMSLSDANNNLTTCWIKNQTPQGLVVSYVTVVAFPFLVILCNSCMLALVVFKMRGLRRSHSGSGSWNKMNKDKGSRLWKDCATVVGLSCVLGLPWALAATTYLSLTGIYIFTILNSLQGAFIFLWSVALTCKSGDHNNSSVRDPSTQKMMTTSFNT